MTTSQTNLINRLSRIEGQISALKRAIETNEKPDCTQTIIQIKTATNGLKSFAETFTRVYAKRCLLEKKSGAHFAKEIDIIISSAFTLS